MADESPIISASVKQVQGGFQIAVWTGETFSLPSGWIEVVADLSVVPGRVREVMEMFLEEEE